MNEQNIDLFWDGVEQVFRYIDVYVRGNEYHFNSYTTLNPSQAIQELNDRLKEGCVGYAYEAGRIVKIRDRLTHETIVVPALHLLSDASYATANNEFMDGHTAYRDGNYEEALVSCCKAFESVLKIIAHKRNWVVSENATAKGLLDAAYTHGLIPTYMQTGFTSLRSLLEGSVPALRNKQGGHGQGAVPRDVPEHLAVFQTNQTAAAIVFLVNQDKALPI